MLPAFNEHLMTSLQSGFSEGSKVSTRRFRGRKATFLASLVKIHECCQPQHKLSYTTHINARGMHQVSTHLLAVESNKNVHYDMRITQHNSIRLSNTHVLLISSTPQTEKMPLPGNVQYAIKLGHWKAQIGVTSSVLVIVLCASRINLSSICCWLVE